MNILVDTHALIWFVEGAPLLSAKAKVAIESPRNQVYYSIATIWEMAIKIQLGKLRMARPLSPDFRRDLEESSFEALPIEYEHVVEAGALPAHHRDPFDRVLVAQAICEGMVLTSQDEELDAYDVRRLW